ncbi:MAG: glycogen synthase [Clostridia bacterium]|nr:glycogen synthase [Clostridia bacterium]
MNKSILFVTTQLYPFTNGSMGVFNYSLPKGLRNQGWDVRVIVPRFNKPVRPYPEEITNEAANEIKMGNKFYQYSIEASMYEDIPVYFLNQPHYFGRDSLYGYPDEAERFIFMCKAIVEALPSLEFKPDIIHCQDWHTAFIPMLLKSKCNDHPLYEKIKTILTIHNLGYQGVFDGENCKFLDMDQETFLRRGIDYYEQVSFMKAGILHTDVITTVSPTYAKEIATEEGGATLHEEICKRQQDLYGVLCGLDMKINNPATDTRLFANYSLEDPKGKHTNKRELQKLLNLPVREDVPVISLFSRLIPEKGLDLVRNAMDDLMKSDIQFVIVSDGHEIYEEYCRKAQQKYPDKFSFTLYNDDLAYKAYAGADMFLMPSRFEPCGIGQLIALRYGTVPIVRKTGGLSDSIQDYDEETGVGNGFTFRYYNAKVMLYTIRKAIKLYHRKEEWNKIVKNGMAQDHGWDKYVGQYIDVYKETLKK